MLASFGNMLCLHTFLPEWKEALGKKNWVRREGSHVISLLNLIGFLRLLFLAGVNQLTNKDIFRPRSSQRNTPFTDSPVYFSWGIYKWLLKDRGSFLLKKLGWGFCSQRLPCFQNNRGLMSYFKCTYLKKTFVHFTGVFCRTTWH